VKQRADSEVKARTAQIATERRRLIFKLRAARAEDRRLATLNQFKQSMAAPDWELEDLEWRPTFLPGMKLVPQKQKNNRNNEQQDPRRRLLLSYLEALADLAAPKAAIPILQDSTRLEAYQLAIQSVLSSLKREGQPKTRTGDPDNNNNDNNNNDDDTEETHHHVLALGAGTGILGLMAADYIDTAITGGTDDKQKVTVTCVERCRMLYRMAEQIAESNGFCVNNNITDESSIGDSVLRIADCRLPAIATITSSTPTTTTSDVYMLPKPADVLITDLFDHSLLGMQILPSLDGAASRNLLSPSSSSSSSVTVVPSSATVYAMLIELKLPSQIAGFDLSGLDGYRWYPTPEKVNLGNLPYRRLSEPFIVTNIDFQARVERKMTEIERKMGGGKGKDKEEEEEDTTDDDYDTTTTHNNDGIWEEDFEIKVDVINDGTCTAIAYWFDLDLLGDGTITLSSFHRQDKNTITNMTGNNSSWGQAVQYFDGFTVKSDTITSIRVRRDTGQFVFTSNPPQCRPRHALVPRWHYDMVLDSARNNAYQQTLYNQVSKLKHGYNINNSNKESSSSSSSSSSTSSCREILALDIGAGTGLLSMMAARAGADQVYAAEVSSHMADVAEETIIANGFLGKIIVLDKDSRRLSAASGTGTDDDPMTMMRPDGTAAELPRRADLAVYEIFDSGLIGEGALHAIAAAKANILKSDAVLVPSGARVYAQPIQMRVETVPLTTSSGGSAGQRNGGEGERKSLDVSQANRWRWRPDYEGIELGQCRHNWIPLSDPVSVFDFDFYQAESNLQPAKATFNVEVTTAGVCNAIAFWFDLHLDENNSLSTSPYDVEKGPTWQQAVQWMEELKVEEGGQLCLVAQHDSYGISFSLQQGGDKGGGEQSANANANANANAIISRTDVPLKDAVWEAAYERLAGLNSQLVKACVQNPLEYRSVALAAVEFAARPHDYKVDVGQAAEFCSKMMG